MTETSPQSAAPEVLKLSEYFSLVPPAGWDIAVSFEGLPMRLLAYGRMAFRPAGSSDVFLKWQIVNWLEAHPEWDVFQDLIYQRGKPSADELSKLYAMLLRIPIGYIADYSVSNHPGLGRVLVIDYQYDDWNYKGRVMYTPSPTGLNDIQIVSYEGAEPEFSTYLIEALQALDSCQGPIELSVLAPLFT